jgi:hypothetical protein
MNRTLNSRRDRRTDKSLEGPDAQFSDVTVTPCEDGSWCSGSGKAADDCCLAGEGYFVVNGTQTRTNPSVTTTAIPSTSLASSTTAITSASAPASPVPTSSPQSSAGSKIGIGVGVGVGVGVTLFLIAMATFLYLRKARKSRARAWDRHDGSPHQNPGELVPHQASTELSSSNVPQLRGSGATDPFEMEQPNGRSGIDRKPLPHTKQPTVELE